MSPEKRKTLLFEPSVVSQSTIDFYVSKGYFPEGVCRPPGPEVFPVPRTREVIVLKDFFTAGLRIPMDPVVLKLLEPFNVKLHHFTPNGIVALSKFLWVARTFGGGVSVDAFCKLFQLHCQPWKVFVDDDEEVWQNHLNYPGSSAQAITIKATPAQTHFKRNNSWSVG